MILVGMWNSCFDTMSLSFLSCDFRTEGWREVSFFREYEIETERVRAGNWGQVDSGHS